MGESGWLRRLVAQEPDAQKAFWQAYRPLVLPICVHVLGDRSQAQDITDEVMIDFIFDAVHRLRSEQAALAYLRLMAARRAIRYRDRRRGEVDQAEQLIDLGQAPDEAAQVNLLLPKLEVCMEKLTPKARKALRLRFVAELTNERIGQMIGGSRQYIGRLITKSLSALGRCIEPIQRAQGSSRV